MRDDVKEQMVSELNGPCMELPKKLPAKMTKVEAMELIKIVEAQHQNFLARDAQMTKLFEETLRGCTMVLEMPGAPGRSNIHRSAEKKEKP